MPPKVGGTTPGAEHDFAIPFESVRTILKKYRDRDPQKNALFDLTQRKSITFGELHDWTNRIANWLVQKGIQKGDRVALLSEERLEKLILWMGIWRAGAVCCPTNVEMNVNYVSEILTHLDCKLAFFDAELDIDKMLEGVVLDKFAFKNWTNHRQDVDPENIFCEI